MNYDANKLPLGLPYPFIMRGVFADGNVCRETREIDNIVRVLRLERTFRGYQPAGQRQNPWSLELQGRVRRTDLSLLLVGLRRVSSGKHLTCVPQYHSPCIWSQPPTSHHHFRGLEEGPSLTVVTLTISTQHSVGAGSRRCSRRHGLYMLPAHSRLELNRTYRGLRPSSSPILHQGMQTGISSTHLTHNFALFSSLAWSRLTKAAANFRLYKLMPEILMALRMDLRHRSSARSGSTGNINSSPPQSLEI